MIASVSNPDQKVMVTNEEECARGSAGKGSYSQGLMTWVQFPEPTRSQENTDSLRHKHTVTQTNQEHIEKNHPP